ncbi:MAG: hypothetical protein GX285_06220 [Clostridiales bacterium]|nr:hypothetical protein [Clostridiales bacterium]
MKDEIKKRVSNRMLDKLLLMAWMPVQSVSFFVLNFIQFSSNSIRNE